MLNKKSNSPLTGNRESAFKEAPKAKRKAFSWLKFLRASTIAIAIAAFTLFLLVMPSNAQSYDSALKGRSDMSPSDPGPENKPLVDANPNTFLPPPTDHGDVPSFWNSFSVAHRRIQEGGWARQVNVDDFPISKEIAGVNMKLNAGAIRELHWHQADEWALMLTGNCRLTAIDLEGHSYVQDVTAGDLWYFPSGIPHSLQGLGPDGAEFMLVFNDGKFSEDNTTLISDWVKHTPREVVAKNWGVPESAIIKPLSTIPEEGKYIFPAPVPPSLEQDRRAAAGGKSPSQVAFDFKMHTMTPTKTTPYGSVRVVDSSNFQVAKNIAAAYVVIKPGGMRELHWHPNSDEWQYYVQGKARMTLFMNNSKAHTADFNANDVGYVPRTFPHYIENTGNTDLIFIEMFKASRFQDVSLNDWMTHIPPELVLQHLNISKETLDTIPKARLEIVPESLVQQSR
ncbi:MAG: cupin domain-containing protein [Rhizonema sp. PD37]|nr:cupin domain-containing protein [Rhizonema sp. PD37]